MIGWLKLTHMRILINGDASFIKSVLTPTLLLPVHQVTVLDNFYFNQNSLLDCRQFRAIRSSSRRLSG